MTDIGLALVLVGAALLVVEAHVAGGVTRGVRRHGPRGGRRSRRSAGPAGESLLVVAAMIAAVAVTGAWLAVAARKALTARRRSIASGTEALSGRTGVVRSWNGQGGQIFVDGALWRAR